MDEEARDPQILQRASLFNMLTSMVFMFGTPTEQEPGEKLYIYIGSFAQKKQKS